MSVQVQRPVRASRVNPDRARPNQPLTPMGRAVLHALADHGGPMPATALAERTGARLASLATTVWAARSALAPVGGQIWSKGKGETLTYTIELLEPGDVTKVAGPPVPRTDLDAYLGLAGVYASLLRTVAAARGPITVVDAATILYGGANDGTIRRIHTLVGETRRMLSVQQSASTIIDVDTPAGPALMWGAPSAAPAVAPVRRTSGITLAPCGYAEWAYEPPTGGRGGRHAVVFAGEDAVRILSETDRTNGLTTDKATIAKPETVDADA